MSMQPLSMRQRCTQLVAAWAHDARLPVWTWTGCKNHHTLRADVRPIALTQLRSFGVAAELVEGIGASSEPSCRCSPVASHIQAILDQPETRQLANLRPTILNRSFTTQLPVLRILRLGQNQIVPSCHIQNIRTEWYRLNDLIVFVR
ncbi:hypothetical protein SNOG_00123 [Parastagonospora nodorum SN15]|uniref:Uncharacterized protein n=1 Tax=Phaeosphaeria nodorum (strain SN15 / ATCC MYA-4574 / FGSC 10173) TaxID=321614 RepID=Q0V791_PHANO|nr:hypothetical protein SNOG_00123 [Parastagonospora nodorum SN15]EAT91618.1 hypothetical protein SNOG_00123 [Parastagonospora nodorum SN15]